LINHTKMKRDTDRSTARHEELMAELDALPEQ
jgi:hypothetical protein